MSNYKLKFNPDEMKLIGSQYCKDCSKDEFQIFIHLCETSGLDPRMRQIWNVTRTDYSSGKCVSQPLVSIDGLRLIAERTERYAPGDESRYTYDDKGRLICATAYVKKMTKDGTWHVVACSAFFSEYAALKKDKTPTKFWAEKPHIMLSKCAEALALRRAFPQEMCGLYTEDEMDKAFEDRKSEEVKEEKPKKKEVVKEEEKKTPENPIVNEAQGREVQAYLNDVSPERKDLWFSYIDHISKVKKLSVYDTVILMKSKPKDVRDNFELWITKQNPPQTAGVNK